MTTLVVHTGGLGDFLLACPAIAHLAGSGPVDLAGRPERMALAVEGGIARQAFRLESIEFESIFGTPSERFRDFVSTYARVVVWMGDAGSIVRALRDAGVADAAAYPGLPPSGWPAHASAYYAQCVGAPTPVSPFRLAFPAIEREPALALIHPGSGGRYKNFPIDQYTRVARELAERGYSVEWVLGPAELEDDGFVALVDDPEVMTATPESPLALARTLARCSVYVGNDSGATHLAAAVGAPTVAVFGPTDATVWGPRGERVTVVRGELWPRPAEVIAGVEEVLA